MLLLKSRREAGASPRLSEKRLGLWTQGSPTGPGMCGRPKPAGLVAAIAPSCCRLFPVCLVAYSGRLFLSLPVLGETGCSLSLWLVSSFSPSVSASVSPPAWLLAQWPSCHVTRAQITGLFPPQDAGRHPSSAEAAGRARAGAERTCAPGGRGSGPTRSLLWPQPRLALRRGWAPGGAPAWIRTPEGF